MRSRLLVACSGLLLLVTISAPHISAESVGLSPNPMLSDPPTMADECIAPPRARLYASASGSHGLLITSARDNPERVKGRMFAFSHYSNKDRTVWNAPLITPPGRALVSDGDVVVTLDIWCRAGWEHSLVVYGSNGRRIADYSLEDLLTAQEIRERVTRSISSREWTAGADFSFEMNPSFQVLKIRFPWGRVLTIDLQTGKLRPETGVTWSANHDVDVKRLLDDIRADVAEQVRGYSLVRSGEFGPGASGDFFAEWRDGDNRIDLQCNQHGSPEEAIRNLRQLRTLISAGIPAPLPGVADEAYYLNYYGRRRFYFARRRFVCQVGAPDEDTSRRVTAILIRRIDQAVEDGSGAAGF